MVQLKQPISQDKNNHIFSSCTNSIAPTTNAFSSFHVDLFCLGKELREQANDTKTMRPIFKCRRTATTRTCSSTIQTKFTVYHFS